MACEVEVRYKHAKGILVKNRTSPEPDMMTRLNKLPDPNGLAKERHIDTPPRGKVERVIPSVKQKKQRILQAITAAIAVHRHGVDHASHMGPRNDVSLPMGRSRSATCIRVLIPAA